MRPSSGLAADMPRVTKSVDIRGNAALKGRSLTVPVAWNRLLILPCLAAIAGFYVSYFPCSAVGNYAAAPSADLPNDLPVMPVRQAHAMPRLPAAPPAETNTQKETNFSILKGEAEVETSLWGRSYSAGLKACEQRDFDEAERKLLFAAKEAMKMGRRDPRSIKTHIALANVYRLTERYGAAEREYNEWLPLARKFFGADNEETAQCEYGLSWINIINAKMSLAEQYAKQSVAAREKLFGNDDYRVGLSLNVLAAVTGRQGWHDEAESLYKRSLEILEKNAPSDDMNLADALRSCALYLQSRGQHGEAAQLFDRSFDLRERATKFDLPSSRNSSVVFAWDRGAPAAKVISEGKYPVEFMNVNGLRVASMVVDLGYRLGVLISIRNNTFRRADVGIGPVALDVLAPKPGRIVPVALDPSLQVCEERAFAWLTRNQPFVYNLLITRKTAGFLENGLPDIKHELGANVFGMYGQWGVSTGEALSRKYGYARAETIMETDKTQSQYMKSLDFVPTVLEPGESRSGIVFFANPIFQEAVLRLTIGNTTFKFPFHAPPRYSPV